MFSNARRSLQKLLLSVFFLLFSFLTSLKLGVLSTERGTSRTGGTAPQRRVDIFVYKNRNFNDYNVLFSGRNVLTITWDRTPLTPSCRTKDAYLFFVDYENLLSTRPVRVP